MWKNCFATFLLFGALTLGRAQLAITEVMSSAALTFQTTNTLPQTSDWWELSNFGTNAIDLTGYTVRWIYRQHTNAGWPDFTSSDPAAVVQTGSLLNGPLGQAQYAWVVGDFAALGYFEGEMWAGNGTNRYSSVRYQWQTYDAISVPSI